MCRDKFPRRQTRTRRRCPRLNRGRDRLFNRKNRTGRQSLHGVPDGFEPAPLTVIVNAGEGHQNQWKLSKEDFTFGADSKTAVSTVKLEIPNKEAETNTTSPKIYSQEELDAALKAAREQAEMQVIAPLRKQLAEAQQPKITWRDIVGGLGWCLGLGGLFAWISTRRQKNK